VFARAIIPSARNGPDNNIQLPVFRRGIAPMLTDAQSDLVLPAEISGARCHFRRRGAGVREQFGEISGVLSANSVQGWTMPNDADVVPYTL
jgi:hypothetical protein